VGGESSTYNVMLVYIIWWWWWFNGLWWSCYCYFRL